MIDTIFIDTSIFEANNFLESKRINEVFKLASRGDIRVVLPKLTYDEIINRISKNVDEANVKFNKYRIDTRILRNVPSLSKKFEVFDTHQIKEELIKILDEKFTSSNFLIIDYSVMSIEVIFKSYFEKSFPFSSSAKKSEFPDAFALKSVENWAREQGIKVFVFSKDNDILNYKGEDIKLVEDFEGYLSEKIKEVEGVRHKKRLEQIEDFVKNHSEKLKDEIKDWVRYQLDDITKYYEYSNLYEVHDLQILQINIDVKDYDITNVTDDFISVQLHLLIKYKVEIEVDDEEYMAKDYDTNEWLFFGTKPVMVDEVRYVDVDLVFDVEPDDDTVYDPEIELINGGRKLNV